MTAYTLDEIASNMGMKSFAQMSEKERKEFERRLTEMKMAEAPTKTDGTSKGP